MENRAPELYRKRDLSLSVCELYRADSPLQGEVLDVDDIKPAYVHSSLWKPLKKLGRRMNKYVAREFGITFDYRDLELDRDNLYYVDFKNGRIGKILGDYTTNGMKKIDIDYDLEHGEVMRVLSHELVHYAQDKLGGIWKKIRKYGRRARDYIERDAERAREAIFEGRENGAREALAGA